MTSPIGAAGFYGEKEYRSSQWNSFPTRVRSFELQEDDYRLIRPVTYTNWQGASWQGKFHRQNNGHDCGACMIANLNSALGDRCPQLDSASSVRTLIDNHVRREVTDPTRWLSLESDLIPLLKIFGFDIWTALGPNLFDRSGLNYKLKYDYVKEHFYKGNIAALICAGRGHFKAFVPNSENSYICLDSLKSAPALVERRDVNEVITECAGGGPAGEFYVLI